MINISPYRSFKNTQDPYILPRADIVFELQLNSIAVQCNND